MLVVVKQLKNGRRVPNEASGPSQSRSQGLFGSEMQFQALQDVLQRVLQIGADDECEPEGFCVGERSKAQDELTQAQSAQDLTPSASGAPGDCGLLQATPQTR